jgi:hypothetical protein
MWLKPAPIVKRIFLPFAVEDESQQKQGKERNQEQNQADSFET